MSSFRLKLLNFCLLISSFFGYMEWGADQRAFVFQAEAELFTKDLANLVHPFVLIPLAGQAMMLYTLFQPRPGRWLTLIALACMSLFMLLLFGIGLMTVNPRILMAALPFVVLGIAVLWYNRKKQAAA